MFRALCARLQVAAFVLTGIAVQSGAAPPGSEQPDDPRWFAVARLLTLIRRDHSQVADPSIELDQTEQLLQTQRLLTIGSLASRMAHDLRNLLTVVELSASTSIDEDPDGPAAADMELILRASRRATALTRNLTDFVRCHSLSFAPVDLGALIADLQPLLGTLLGDQVVLELDVAPELWPIHAEPTAIEQLLVNLTLNSRDAMSGAGRLAVGARNLALADGRQMVEVAVVDEGPGIAPELREQIFEPFWSTKATGSGLGLATCRWIAEQLGGTIGVADDGPGTTMVVQLPAWRPPRT